MITTRSSAIRFGVSKTWPVRSAELNFFSSNFDTNLRIFFEKLFLAPLIVGSGVAISGVLLSRFSNFFVVDVYLQDSRLLDWLWTKPSFRVRRCRKRRVKKGSNSKPRGIFKFFKRSFYVPRTVRLSKTNAFLKFCSRKTQIYKTLRGTILKRRWLRRLRKYRKFRALRARRTKFRIMKLARRPQFRNLFTKVKLNLKRNFAPTIRRISIYKFFYERFKQRRRTRRLRRQQRKKRRLAIRRYRIKHRRFKFKMFKRRRKMSKNSFYYKSVFFKHFFNFSRFRFYQMYARFMLSNLFLKTAVPIKVNLYFIPNSINTTQFYLNYITTKLYYRYIITDVVKPIVRMSLRYYRGFRITCKGRFTRAQIAIERTYTRGSLKFSNISVPLDYGQKFVVLKYGVCNLKIWIRY